ncbi:MAG: helix-turn-helix transcriptional regulator [Clostridia bacterium]|nr:helix-turn-helix transcriptional regulator [Clostridia bacterium]
MNLQLTFSKNLIEAVKTSPLNYAELSKALGITKATMSMYKHGKALPSLDTFNKICEILDVSADYLLGRKEF